MLSRSGPTGSVWEKHAIRNYSVDTEEGWLSNVVGTSLYRLARDDTSISRSPFLLVLLPTAVGLIILRLTIFYPLPINRPGLFSLLSVVGHSGHRNYDSSNPRISVDDNRGATHGYAATHFEEMPFCYMISDYSRVGSYAPPFSEFLYYGLV